MSSSIQPQPTEPQPVDPNRPTQEGVANVEDYDKGYTFGINETQGISDSELTAKIDNLRNDAERLTDFGRGMLEAYEYEQQRRAMEQQLVPVDAETIPKTEETAPEPTETSENITETVPNTEIPVENVQQPAPVAPITNELLLVPLSRLSRLQHVQRQAYEPRPPAESGLREKRTYL